MPSFPGAHFATSGLQFGVGVPLMRITAHQGGWDEIGMVAVPVAIFAGLLWLANRRAIRAAEAQSDDELDPVPPGDDPVASPRDERNGGSTGATSR